MLTLPDAIVSILVPFATLFTKPTPGRGRGQAWLKAQVLLVGAILTPGQRTVAAALRVMGRSDQRDYAHYHEVLNRAVWSSRAAARILLALLLQHLDRGDGPLVFGIDETLERRRGPKIKARGIYRDAVHSSRQQLVKASGLRWISLMWLGHIPWAGRHWALPVLTVLAPSARYYRQQGRRHKKLTDWARQMVLQLRRWLPHRSLVLVGDNSYAVLDLLHCCQSLAQPVTLIARLRLDAALYAPAPPRQPGQNGRPPLKGARRPPLKALLEPVNVAWASAVVAWYDGTTRAVELTSQTAVWYRSGKPPVLIRWILVRDPQGEFTPQALLCTDPSADPTQILEWFVLRWQLEVTFREARTHLAIARTTPILMGLFSWTTLAAHLLGNNDPRPIAQRLGTPSRRRPSWMPSLWCAATCGWRRRVFTVRRRPRYTESPGRSVPPTRRFPCLRRLKCVKSSLAVVVIVNVVLLYPEIKEMRDPAARIYRRGVEKSESNKRQRAKTMIEHVRRMPVAGRTCYEPSTGTVIAEIKWPRPIRRRVMRCATWLVNCRLMPKVVYFGVVRRLGYQYKESDEGYPLGKD